MIRSKQQSPSRPWGPAWLHKKEFTAPAPKCPGHRSEHVAVTPKRFNFVDDHNEQSWQQLSEQDYEYLVGPRNYPSPCPRCGGRLVHSEACHELQASWELVMPFGKYKGRKVSELPDGYKAWLRQQPGLPAELTAAL